MTHIEILNEKIRLNILFKIKANLMKFQQNLMININFINEISMSFIFL
jgi:predicted DNA-binding protein YlxM (UPF0122 family)